MALVEVILCKDCRFYDDRGFCTILFADDISGDCLDVEDDDFCSYAKPKLTQEEKEEQRRIMEERMRKQREEQERIHREKSRSMKEQGFIEIVCGDSVRRKRTYQKPEITPRQVFKISEIDYKNRTIHLDGRAISEGELDKSMSELGVDGACYLLAIVKSGCR